MDNAMRIWRSDREWCVRVDGVTYAAESLVDAMAVAGVL